jgi:hypothetical protein
MVSSGVCPAVHRGESVKFAAHPFGCTVGLRAISAPAPVHHPHKGGHATIEVGTFSCAVNAQDIPHAVDAVRNVEQAGFGGFNPIKDGLHRTAS